MQIKADLHIHSAFSFDSDSSPEKIIKHAEKKKLHAIAITDHDTFEGAAAVSEYAGRNSSIQVIKGIEVTSTQGDIIGLFLEQGISSRAGLEVIDEIREKGGVSILAHPFRGGLPDEKIVEGVGRRKRDSSRRRVGGCGFFSPTSGLC